MSLKAVLRPRRRWGITSPPLTGIEQNPGPKRKATRKNAKDLRTKKRPKLTDEEKEKIQELWEKGLSKEEVIRALPQYNPNTVLKWINRLIKQGNTKRKTPVMRKELQEEKTKDIAKPYTTYSQLSEFEKGEIIGMYDMGASINLISTRLECARATVRLWIDRWEQDGTVERRKGSGRPRVTLPGDDRYIKILSLDDPYLTAVEIAPMITDDSSEEKASVHTIRRRLLDFGLYARRPRKKPLLKPHNIKARLEWAHKHLHWKPEQWQKVMWSDESPFQLFNSGSQYVRRPKCAALDPKYTIKTVKKGGGKINVWGCFHYRGVGVLKRIDGVMDSEYYKQILIKQAMPKMKELAAETEYVAWVFQHDNDPKHTAHTVTNYLDRKKDELGIQVMDWPSQSPDLNPIEHVWGYIKHQLRKRKDKPTSLDQLYEHIKEEWARIPHRVLNNLVESMPRRCAAVIKNKGYSTKY
jgi:transposase-like protein